MGSRQLAWVWVALAVAGCTLIIDADKAQCRVDADCTSRGGAFAGTVCDSKTALCAPEPAWSCLDSPPTVRTDPGPFHVELPVVDLVTFKPLVGVSAQLCAKIDVDCTSPLTPVIHSDSQGVLPFDLNLGFDGYVQLRGPGIFPTLYFFNPPVNHSFRFPPTPLTSTQTNDALAVQINVPLLPDRGIVTLAALNCQSQPVAGVSFSTPGADEKVVSFYVAAGLPISTAETTDITGLGGLVNVLSGASTFTGTLRARNREVSSISLLVRPGNLTYSRIVPRGASDASGASGASSD